MTVQTIRPSTTKKITTAIAKTMSYRSRICWPSTLFASGGKKLRQIDCPLTTTRMASPTRTAAAISHPTMAVVDGLLPGADDIDGPRARSAASNPGPGRRRQVEIGAGLKAASDAGRIAANHSGGASWGAPHGRAPGGCRTGVDRHRRVRRARRRGDGDRGPDEPDLARVRR